MLIGRDPGAIEDIWKFLCKGAYWRGGPIQNSALAARYPYERKYLPATRRADESMHGY